MLIGYAWQLLIVVPCVLATILVALIVHRCRALHRRRVRELAELRMGIRPNPPEDLEGKPILYDITLDLVTEQRVWKEMKVSPSR